MKLIVYSSDSEVLICTKKKEKELKKLYFGPNNRDIDEYDREVFADGIVEIHARLICL